MPCDIRIRVKALDLSRLYDICSRMGLQVTKTSGYIHVNGKGVNKVYRDQDFLNLTAEELRTDLGRAVQEYSKQKTLEALRKQGLKFQQKQVEGRIEIMVES